MPAFYQHFTATLAILKELISRLRKIMKNSYTLIEESKYSSQMTIFVAVKYHWQCILEILYFNNCNLFLCKKSHLEIISKEIIFF